MSAVLYQIYYAEEQKTKCFPFATLHFNPSLTIFFENAVIADLVMASEADKIGVVSWKLQDKLKMRVGMRKPLTLEALNSDYDVLAFTRNSQRHQMLGMANVWHKEFIPTIKLLWEKLGYKMPGEAKQPIYQNHFSCRATIYKRYVEEFLKPAMEITLKDEQLYFKMIQASGYGKLQRGADIKSVKDKLGMLDYPLAPFILERCPSLWMDLHRIKVSYL